MSDNSYTNRNAVIRVREDARGNLRTETARRDDGASKFAVSTSPETNRTSLYIDLPGTQVQLSGANARTIYRLLRKHFKATGKSVRLEEEK